MKMLMKMDAYGGITISVQCAITSFHFNMFKVIAESNMHEAGLKVCFS